MKKTMLIVVAIVIVAAVAYVKMGTKPLSYVGYNSSSSPVPSGSPAKSVYKTKAAATPVVSSSAVYTDLVKQYGANRIQFDEKCQTMPTSVTFKNNTSVLLDNRSPSARTVTIGTTKYQLAGYGYKAVTLSSTSLPKELSISCGASYNVGKILLQAKLFGQ